MPRRWPIVVLIVAPIIMLAPIVLFGRVLYWGVPLLQFYPWQHAAIESLRSGQLPLWNPLVGSGAPLAANLQTGTFYPLNFLHLILPTEYAQSYTALLHVILAGVFMYAFMRSLRLQPFAALIAALAYQLCGFFIARLSFFSVTSAFPWIAAWLWRSERLSQSLFDQAANQRTPALAPKRSAGASVSESARDVTRNGMSLALAIGLGILAGHAQTAVYGLILISAYFIWRVITSLPRQRVLLSSFHLVIAIVLGLGFAAIQLLPAAELTRESQRAIGLDYTQVMTHSYWPPRLLTMLSPDFFGNPAQNNFWGYDNYWENAAYIGVIPLLLAFWAVSQAATLLRFPSKARRERKQEDANLQLLITFFALTVIVSLILAFGWFTPIYPFLYQTIPGFALFQGPARWLVVTMAAWCALAGMGAQRWIDHGFSRRATTRLIALGLPIALAGFAASFILKGNFATFAPATLRFGVLLMIAGWFFKLEIRDRRSKIMVVTIITLDLITAHFALNPSLPAGVYHAPNATADAIKADGLQGRVFYFDADEETIKFGRYLAHAKKFDGFGTNDLNDWLRLRETLLPNVAMIDGVPSANDFDSLIVNRYQNLLDKINTWPLDQALPLLSRMNVAYIISPRLLDLPVMYRGQDVTIYRNEAALPRAWVAPVNSDLNQVSSQLTGSLIESLTDSGNAVTIHAVSPQAGWLILSDVWYPGWRATIDETAVEIYPANEVFRAVQVPAGEHQVEFRYEPQSVRIGSWITVTCAVIVIAGWMSTNRPRIHKSANSK